MRQLILEGVGVCCTYPEGLLIHYTDAELVRRLTPKDSGDPTTADATIDRLREMCAAIVTTGESWRSK